MIFSDTILGTFLMQVASDRQHELQRAEHAYAFVSLILADMVMEDNAQKRLFLLRYLKKIYGVNGKWKITGASVSKEILKHVERMLAMPYVPQLPRLAAYLNGMLGNRYDVRENTLEHWRARSIHQRQLRVFWNRKVRASKSDHLNLIICLLGLKGSGKTSVLGALAEAGEETFEVYYELDRVRRDRRGRMDELPPPILWRNEPLRLGFEHRKLHMRIPNRLFVGSLLRHEELRYLSRFGQLVLVSITAKNRIRHARARRRGRRIEKGASEDWLVELDAHRGGEWPGYETNDAGGLMFPSSLVVENNVASKKSEIARRILEYVRTLQKEVV